ncbi:MAG: hypothetical protein GF375_05005 [Candidatus Omnitrophica bacterium]|nr:hypothetical protein [Candidatus Omnitrophota bacterium]
MKWKFRYVDLDNVAFTINKEGERKEDCPPYKGKASQAQEEMNRRAIAYEAAGGRKILSARYIPSEKREESKP